MDVNFSNDVYLPNFEMWARPINVMPLIGTAYSARGIYHSDYLQFAGDGGSIISDQQTTLDIRDAEFGALPGQGDQISIPQSPSGMPALGTFEVINIWNNGGGETTLQLRKVLPQQP